MWVTPGRPTYEAAAWGWAPRPQSPRPTAACARAVGGLAQGLGQAPTGPPPPPPPPLLAPPPPLRLPRRPGWSRAPLLRCPCLPCMCCRCSGVSWQARRQPPAPRVPWSRRRHAPTARRSSHTRRCWQPAGPVASCGPGSPPALRPAVLLPLLQILGWWAGPWPCPANPQAVAAATTPQHTRIQKRYG